MSRTEWVVLTGAASAGKSSVLKELSRRGYNTMPEAATLALNQADSNGKDISNFQNTESFHRKVEELNREMETRYPSNKLVFMDRSLIDNVAYKAYYQDTYDYTIINEAQDKYKKVLFLEKIPFKQNDREKPKEEASEIEKLLKQAYREADYHPIEVGLGSVTERADEILSHLQD